jgi:hypothetical protein
MAPEETPLSGRNDPIPEPKPPAFAPQDDATGKGGPKTADGHSNDPGEGQPAPGAGAKPSPPATNDHAPGGSFASAWHIVLIALYLVVVGTLVLYELIDRWPRCTPESAAVSEVQPASKKPATSPTPKGTEVTGTDVHGTEVEGTRSGVTPAPSRPAPPSTTQSDPVVPRGGPIEGGTLVTLHGSGFEHGAQVHFGEAAASGVEVVDSGTIQARTPLHEAGSVIVTVIDSQGASRPIGTFVYGCEPLAGGQLLLLVALAGALAGALHAARSLYYFVGNRFFKQSWILMYLLLPLVGATLASVFYIVFIAGLYDPQKGERSLLIVGVAALVGMFSEQAVEKLKKIAEAIFTQAPQAKDKVPVVKVTAIDPKTSKPTGTKDVEITGEGFGAGTRVFFGEQAVVPKSIEPTKLKVDAPAHAAGKVNVIVDVPGGAPCTLTDGFEYQ